MCGVRTNSMPEAYLYMEDGRDVFRLHLKLDRYYVGSAPENDIRINDPRVGKRHCSISFADGVFSVSARKRAVRVGGRLVTGTTSLTHGAVIDLEGTAITFVLVPECPSVTLQIGVRKPGERPWFTILARPHIYVGRSPASLCVDDPKLDDRHFEIENFGPDLIFVKGLTKKSVTTLNGEPLNARRRLRDGDHLRAGASEFHVRILERELPALDEALEWRALRQVSSPDVPSRTSKVDSTAGGTPEGRATSPESQVEPTMDSEELKALAAQVEALRTPGEDVDHEQAAVATLLVSHEQLTRHRANAKAAAKAKSQTKAHAKGKGRPGSKPKAKAKNSAAKRPRVNPNKAVKTRRPPPDSSHRQAMEELTQTDLPVAPPRSPAAQGSKTSRRPPRETVPDTPAVVAPKDRAARKGGKASQSDRRAAPRKRRPGAASDESTARTTGIPVQNADPGGPADAAVRSSVPYYLPRTEQELEPEASPAPIGDDAKPGQAYYLPGQGGAGRRRGAVAEGQAGTMTDVPLVGGGVVTDEDDDAYYLPTEEGADEVRRRSRTDYYEESEDARAAARRRLRREQGQPKPRTDARSVPRRDRDGRPKDIDFGEQ